MAIYRIKVYSIYLGGNKPRYCKVIIMSYFFNKLGVRYRNRGGNCEVGDF